MSRKIKKDRTAKLKERNIGKTCRSTYSRGVRSSIEQHRQPCRVVTFQSIWPGILETCLSNAWPKTNDPLKTDTRELTPCDRVHVVLLALFGPEC